MKFLVSAKNFKFLGIPSKHCVMLSARNTEEIKFCCVLGALCQKAKIKDILKRANWGGGGGGKFKYCRFERSQFNFSPNNS